MKVDLEALLAPEDVKETEIEVEVAKDFVEVGSQSVSSSDKETENTAEEKENVSSEDNSQRVKVSKHYRVGRLWQLVRTKLSIKSSN